MAFGYLHIEQLFEIPKQVIDRREGKAFLFLLSVKQILQFIPLETGKLQFLEVRHKRYLPNLPATDALWPAQITAAVAPKA